MGNQARQLLEAALALPKTERAELAAQIRASVEAEDSGADLRGEYEPDPSVEKAWGDEIARRVERVMRGEAKGVPGEVVKAWMIERFGPK